MLLWSLLLRRVSCRFWGDRNQDCLRPSRGTCRSSEDTVTQSRSRIAGIGAAWPSARAPCFSYAATCAGSRSRVRVRPTVDCGQPTRNRDGTGVSCLTPALMAVRSVRRGRCFCLARFYLGYLCCAWFNWRRFLFLLGLLGQVFRGLLFANLYHLQHPRNNRRHPGYVYHQRLSARLLAAFLVAQIPLSEFQPRLLGATRLADISAPDRSFPRPLSAEKILAGQRNLSDNVCVPFKPGRFVAADLLRPLQFVFQFPDSFLYLLHPRLLAFVPRRSPQLQRVFHLCPP